MQAITNGTDTFTLGEFVKLDTKSHTSRVSDTVSAPGSKTFELNEYQLEIVGHQTHFDYSEMVVIKIHGWTKQVFGVKTKVKALEGIIEADGLVSVFMEMLVKV